MTEIRMEPGWERHLEAALLKVTTRATGDVADDARRGCPIDTGELVESIEAEVVSPTLGRVWVRTDHWAPTEYGSGPHKIRSHGAYPLRSAEGEVFGREVNHPGTPEQAFMRPAIWRRRTLRIVP